MIDVKRLLDIQYYMNSEASSFLYVYFTFFTLVTVFAFVSKSILKRKIDFPAYKSLSTQIYFTYLFFGLLGLGATFMRFEKIPGFEPRAILFFIIGLFLITNIWLAIYYFKWTKKSLYKFHYQARKDKWLKKSKKN